MRCLTLADALRQQGDDCRFACRALDGNLMDLIREKGFSVIALGKPSSGSEPAPLSGEQLPAHASWLECDWRVDAEQTRRAVQDLHPDWLIVDHYALDHNWETVLRKNCDRIMVFDDLADRPHDCDILLDQNLGRSAADYFRFVRGETRLLIGPEYALLRSEFAAMREYSLRRRESPHLATLLINMGGIDTHNATGRILEALQRCPLPTDCRIIVITGLHAPWLESIRELARGLSWRCEIKTNIRNMAQLMADSDLAIGGAGSSSWERCALGLPTLTLALADNQRPIATALEAAGAAIDVGSLLSVKQHLFETLSATNGDLLKAMSIAARNICDGRGTLRVLRIIEISQCHVRAVQRGDLEMILEWRNHPDIRPYMRQQHRISLPEHQAWFSRVSQDLQHHLLIVEENNLPLGFVQFTEVDENGTAEWGFYKSPAAPKGSGSRLCNAALNYAFNDLKLKKIVGKVLRSNARSAAFHLKLGFVGKGAGKNDKTDPELDLLQFTLLASDWN